MTTEQVILVNKEDQTVGVMEKLEAHQKGLLHRAFSVFIFDNKGRMLIQQRSQQKYHGAGLWTNACCSHPLPHESTENAAGRRLFEELGFTTSLEKVFEFLYHSEVENNLIEHEFDHVFAGEYDGAINVNPLEVSDFCYKDLQEIKWSMQEQPHKFSSWFKLAFPAIETWWHQQYRNQNKVET
ncbi:MAG: isopentenyl-diphosphate Delta-isomerase [Chitinophagaceae bacterium]